jgi:peptidyl-prolyl cis-trans isomerase D
MLNNIRKASDSVIIRILLAMIAFAFVGWGIKDVLQAKHNQDLVIFSNAKNISEADFLKAKAEEISNIQRQTGASLNDNEINQLDIDDIVLQRLIEDSMIQYLVGYYDLDISDETIIEFVKSSPTFKNAKGEFDIEIFKSAFKNSHRSEEDYLLNIKKDILKDTLLSILLESFKTPEIMIKNFVDYMAEVRQLDLVSIDLKNKPKDFSVEAPTTEMLEEFYKNNQELFTLPEMRNFSLVKIPNRFLLDKINITNDELMKFYNENKEDFNSKNFEQAKNTIGELLQKQKYEELSIEFNKNLEDAVAAGSTLLEIAEKFGLKLEELNNITYDDLLSDKTGIANAADNIFELTEGEVSYPVELEDKSGFLLVELKLIKPSKVEDFSNIKERITALWNEKYLEDINIKFFDNLAKDYKPGSFNIKYLAANGVNVNTRFSISRSEFNNNQLPEELIMSIFQIKKGSNSNIFKYKDKAYFAHLKSTKLDPNIERNVQKKARSNISNHIKYGAIDELLSYLSKQNKIRIKKIAKQDSY